MPKPLSPTCPAVMRPSAVLALLLTLIVLIAACSSGEDAGGAETTEAEPREKEASTEVDLSAVDAAVDEFVAANGLNGAGLVVVDREEGIVHEHYTGEINAERISLVASASKMITAGVLMRLDDQEILDVDAPVAEVVDWGSAHPEITPVQLVSNSSGLVGLLDGDVAGPYVCQYLAVGTLQDCARTIFTTPGDDADVVPPDTKFRYGGGQWQVAGAVAEIASGKTWAELVRETYVEPCGTESLAYNNHFAQIVSPEGPFRYPPQFDGDPSKLRPTENPNMEGGAYITPPDYAELLLMHLRGGVCGDERVLSEEAVERMHTDRIGPTYGASTDLDSDQEGYGLGWWVDRDDPGYIQDGGAFGAMPWLDLDAGYGAYLVIEETSRTGRQLAEQIRPMIEEALEPITRR